MLLRKYPDFIWELYEAQNSVLVIVMACGTHTYRWRWKCYVKPNVTLIYISYFFSPNRVIKWHKKLLKPVLKLIKNVQHISSYVEFSMTERRGNVRVRKGVVLQQPLANECTTLATREATKSCLNTIPKSTVTFLMQGFPTTCDFQTEGKRGFNRVKKPTVVHREAGYCLTYTVTDQFTRNK
jgi:hypothetical protein